MGYVVALGLLWMDIGVGVGVAAVVTVAMRINDQW